MKVSIITTIYKAEKDLPRLLDSMMALKSPELEFFLIDNGSPDRCGEICAEYAKKDPRFVVRTIKDNIGYIGARNLGITEVAADYIGFCDSNDILEPGGYDKAIAKLRETDCDLFIAAYKDCREDGRNVIKCPPFETGLYRGNKLDVIKTQVYGFLPGRPQLKGFVWKQIYKHSIIKGNKFSFTKELQPYEDEIFNIDFVNACQSIMVSDGVIYNYINNPASITQRMLSQFSIQDEWNRVKLLFEERKRRSYPSVDIAIGNTMLEYLYGLVLWTVKSSPDTVSETVRQFISVVDQDKIDEICSNHSSNLGNKMNVFAYCMKRHHYHLLFKMIRVSLRMKN